MFVSCDSPARLTRLERKTASLKDTPGTVLNNESAKYLSMRIMALAVFLNPRYRLSIFKADMHTQLYEKIMQIGQYLIFTFLSMEKLAGEIFTYLDEQHPFDLSYEETIMNPLRWCVQVIRPRAIHSSNQDV